jgi:hypothetical protein
LFLSFYLLIFFLGKGEIKKDLNCDTYRIITVKISLGKKSEPPRMRKSISSETDSGSQSNEFRKAFSALNPEAVWSLWHVCGPGSTSLFPVQEVRRLSTPPDPLQRNLSRTGESLCLVEWAGMQLLSSYKLAGCWCPMLIILALRRQR